MNVGKDPRRERPKQRRGWKAGTKQDGGGKCGAHRQFEGLPEDHLLDAARRDRNDVEWAKRRAGEKFERDPFEARDMTPKMSVIDIDRHWSPQVKAGTG